MSTTRLGPRLWLLFGLLFTTTSVAFGGDPAPSAKVDYNRQVRPILSDKCLACHGPDAEQREAGLRLDVRDEAIAVLDTGKRAIVPGKLDASEIVKRIDHSKPNLRMPPAKSNKVLTQAEKTTLRDWIAQGAEYQTHWAFNPPRRPPLPALKNPGWVRNPIDAFLLAKMEKEGLTPTAEADRPTLIRRLTLDLTGLPPTPAEVDAFLADKSAEAYENLVDRLLANPHYGERMALEWLDAARFADTHGYHIDSGRDMTRWREWVIDSFNANLPFDRFTVEQVAGDLLPNATRSQKIASGFNRNHMINFEGGAVPEEYQTAYIIDRVNTTGTVWLGLTVGCTQCHDHKYDPITQKEFYQFYAFFNNLPEKGLDGAKGNADPLMKAPSIAQEADLAGLDLEIARVQSQLHPPLADNPALASWEASLKSNLVSWATLTPTQSKAKSGTKLTASGDGVIVADGPNPPTETYIITAQTDLAGLSAVRVELIADSRWPNNGPGRSVNGNVVLTDVKVSVGGKPLEWAKASADFSQETFPVAKAIDRDPVSGWAISPEFGKPHAAVFSFKSPVKSQGDGKITVELAFNSPFPSHQPGKFRLSTTKANDPHGSLGVPSAIGLALAVEPGKRTDAQKESVRDYYRSAVDPEGKRLSARLADLKGKREALDRSIPTAMIMQEMSKPRDTFLLLRGQYDKKGDQVRADVPAILPPLPDDAVRNRLTLAQWLVDPKHPLVGRVTVNRYWQTFFGTGLVKTAEDFGSQGEAPSHPELLDWLAVDFVSPEVGKPWDVKRLVKRIVTSAAYRQASVVTPAGLLKDPENRLLARGSRYRLAAEFIRDQALAVSGLLNPSIGGKSVSPYQPPGLWEELASREDGANWTAQSYTQSHGADLYRRTMYTYWKRTSPPPTLVTFDAPDRETCTVRRARTNTPLQALVLMNDPTYVEASRKLAERVLKEGGSTDESRLSFAFRLATARAPLPEERAILKRVLDLRRVAYRREKPQAEKLLKVGESARDSKLDPTEVAAWTAVSSVILNLDETVTRG